MKLAMFDAGDGTWRLGMVAVAEARLLDVSEAAAQSPSALPGRAGCDPPAGEAGGWVAGTDPAAAVRELPRSVDDVLRGGLAARRRLEALWAYWLEAGRDGQFPWRPLDVVRLGAPLPRPGKIIAIGLNYREHVAEQRGKSAEFPVIFAKFPTAVVGLNDAIVLPRLSHAVDYEGELAVVIGASERGGHRDLTIEEAAGAIAGYTILNDVTARDLQKSDRQWVRSKSFDTFCPMGPWLVTADELGTPPRRRLCTRVNGEVRQESDTGMMLHDPVALVAWLSQAFTLEVGDVIATGTPSGVGAYREVPVFLQNGDVVTIEIEGVGVLRNPVTAP